jgi:tetratricopeptide (TPR) repeat protein
MKQVSQGAHVRLDSDDAAWVFSNFENNLERLIDFWRSQNVPLIVSDVSSNLMFPPFIHDTLATETENSIARAYQSQKFDDALALLQPLHQRDSTNAFVEYWLGKTLLSSSHPERAKQLFIRARDNDLLKFRAPSQINEIIRSVCERKSVPFHSVDSLFASLSASAIPGDDLFWEHLHPNANGYYAIARSFMQQVVYQRLIRERENHGTISALPYNVDSLSISWIDLAYADLSIQRLTKSWPFEHYDRRTVVFDTSSAPLQQIAVAAYQRRFVWDEACYKTAEYFWRIGRTRAAQTTYEAIIEEYPYNFYAHYLLGSLLAKTEKPQEALHHFSLSARFNSAYPNSRLDAGLLLINQGEFDNAIQLLQEALPLTDEHEKKALRANVLYGLGAAFANKQLYADAMRSLDEALRLVPNYTDAAKLKSGITQHLAK